MSHQNPEDKPMTILDSAAQTIAGAAEAVTGSIVGAKDMLVGKAQEAKEFVEEKAGAIHEEVHAEGKDLPQVWSKAGNVECNTAAEGLVREACALKQEACKNISTGEAELQQAQMAQKAAEAMAAQANVMTGAALAKELEGQEKMVAAGNKLMEAGAQLQQEASAMGTRQADINLHATTQIRQDTHVEAANVPPAELHVLQQRGAMECKPVIEQTYASTKVETEVQRPVM